MSVGIAFGQRREARFKTRYAECGQFADFVKSVMYGDATQLEPGRNTTSRTPRTPLRRGWTTGTCAAAASAAAYQGLVTGEFPNDMMVLLPKGEVVSLAVHGAEMRRDAAIASVIKDAGDDPDVTHGAEITATVQRGAPGSGIAFSAGEGVGTVTLPGLPLDVGEPAINPGPRAMIREALWRLSSLLNGPADVSVTISVPNGAQLAEKTLNSRLGIVGGISILGTTGIVTPFSCSAWIHSIHRGIDVARAAGLTHVAAATGRTSEAAVRQLYDLPDVALIDMGDFVGGTLKYLRRHPISRLTLAGGFAKLAKLGQGNLYLHSSRSRVDIPALARTMAEVGGSSGAVEEASRMTTAAQVLALAEALALPLANAVADGASRIAAATVGSAVTVEAIVVNRAGDLIGRSDA